MLRRSNGYTLYGKLVVHLAPSRLERRRKVTAKLAEQLVMLSQLVAPCET